MDSKNQRIEKREELSKLNPPVDEDSPKPATLTARELYGILQRHYGTPPWWSEDAYRIMVEAVLVQRTTWSNVQKIREAFGGRLSPDYIENLPPETLENLIRPCGFHKAKTKTIRVLTDWYRKYHCDPKAVEKIQPERLRQELLGLRGVGPETADVILVYSFRLPFFIVDAYTRTLLKRLGCSFLNDSEIKRFFEQGLNKDAVLYGYCHWLILEHCIAQCKKKPLCGGCPFDACAKNFEQAEN